MTASPRLRFAPSPTGYLHVGNARTALYNQLIARREGGTIILRVEDTDQERHIEDATEVLQRAMLWLGLEWDDGPYFQSQNRGAHDAAAARLLDLGLLYYCDCTRDQIDARTKGSPTPGYDGHCRDLNLGPGEGCALRFRVPRDVSITVPDVVRNNPVFDSNTIEDFIVVRSSGAPMFVLANVVDDIDMAISHVFRGEEHLSTTPKYLMLWEALADRPPPVFAHLPLLVNERRQKLSKRRDKVAIEDFREEGYLPEAMINYLALCGWSPGDDREILTMEEMVAAFRIDQVVPSSAYFDFKKLAHVNGEWVRRLAVEDFIERCAPFLERGSWPADKFDPAVFAAIAAEVQTRVVVLSEVPGYVDFLFLDEAPVVAADWDKAMAMAEAPVILDGALTEFAAAAAWDTPTLHDLTEAISERLGLKLGRAQAPIRVAVTGKRVGPPLFESMALLGRDRTLDRLRTARARLSA